MWWAVGVSAAVAIACALIHWPGGVDGYVKVFAGLHLLLCLVFVCVRASDLWEMATGRAVVIGCGVALAMNFALLGLFAWFLSGLAFR